MTTKFQMEPERLPAAWIPLPGFGVAMSLLFLFRHPSFLDSQALRLELPILALAILCLTAMAASLFRWRAARVLAIAVLASYWAAVGAGCLFMLAVPNFFAFILFYAGVIALPAFLIVGLCTAYARRGLKSLSWLGSVVAGFSCGFLIAAVLFASTHKGAPNQTMPWPPPTEPTVLGEDLIKLVKCSRGFATLHPESGYPASLTQIGPAGTGCLSEALISGALSIGGYKGFAISYHPGVRNARGVIENFTANAEQAAPHGADFSTISTDESGLVLYKYEGPGGKGIPRSYAPAERAIETLVNCLWNASIQNWSKLPQSEQVFRRCLGDEYVFKNDRNGEVGAHTFAYSFEHNDSGAIDGFTGEIRPRTYGIAGIRSYFIVGKFSGPGAASEAANGTLALRVYATPEDRSATSSDPLAKPCEIKWVACAGPEQAN